MKKLLCFVAAMLSAAILVGCTSSPKTAAAESNSATFTRDYDSAWMRFYSVEDYLAGRYRSNFKNISCENRYDIAPGYDSVVNSFILDGHKLYLGWGNETYIDDNGVSQTYNYLKLSDENGEISLSDKECSYFRFEGNTGAGIVAQVTIDGKDYVLAIAGRNTNFDGFRMWVEDSLPSDKAEKSTDSYGFINYDYLDVKEGVYKPGYKRLWGTKASEYADWYDINNSPVYKYEYNGVPFVIGFNNNCENLILTLDKKNAEPVSKSYFKCMMGNKGNRRMTLGYVFEGKVFLGNKEVTMAVVQCNGYIRVFIKE